MTTGFASQKEVGEAQRAYKGRIPVIVDDQTLGYPEGVAKHKGDLP